ncbi:peptidylprolyl isomerase [Sinomonas sp. JGH33]|uniref:peptidylprolyl isomerase n=1 Tax=Sinomonas terricola TaxID=3110330 RepID=A0ABU5T6Q8_9MICC|nr:peptidylprolyl isomerase [Sinomonas sp. JGH33]MEA5455371.1 peptidylprolyl isomerase [Sinomonas sp. JGH33]
MRVSKRNAQEARRRVQLMEAKQSLRRGQESRRRRDNLIASAAVVLAVAVAGVLQGTVFASNPTAAEYEAVKAGLQTPSTSPSASPSNGPGVPAASTAAGKTFSGSLVLNGASVGVSIDGTKAPQAAAVFKAIADQGLYKGRACHRLTTGQTASILQCGAEDASGKADPSYTWGPLENTPADQKYPAGTIAVARTSNNAYGNGQQLFIAYKDSTFPNDSAGGYTVVGHVTSGLDVIAKIGAAGVAPGGSTTDDGAPVTPVTIDSFTLN